MAVLSMIRRLLTAEDLEFPQGIPVGRGPLGAKHPDVAAAAVNGRGPHAPMSRPQRAKHRTAFGRASAPLLECHTVSPFPKKEDRSQPGGVPPHPAQRA